MKAFGRVGVLAHVAAVLKRRNTAAEITEEDWDLQLGVNLKSSFFLNMAAADLFREQGQGGRIINLVSTSWWTGGTSVAIPYASSKGGLVSMSRGLAKNFAVDGITVNTVAPGGVDTAMMRADLSVEQIDAYVATIPIGRLADPAEIASAILFLASDHAAYITGTTLNVSGGQLLY
jgi:NAD(P)-dependent dehydrogenase (short-subunit alcohol dehydrogenase family)